MNERIKELFEQAHERKPTMRTSPVTWQPVPALGHDGVPMYSNEFNPDMFAELIVRECADIADQEAKEQKTNHGKQAADRIWHTIMNRFRVEE